MKSILKILGFLLTIGFIVVAYYISKAIIGIIMILPIVWEVIQTLAKLVNS